MFKRTVVFRPSLISFAFWCVRKQRTRKDDFAIIIDKDYNEHGFSNLKSTAEEKKAVICGEAVFTAGFPRMMVHRVKYSNTRINRTWQGGDTGMVGIIGAMEEEVAALKEDMDIQETVEKASMVFCKGILCGREVVVVRSGIGKVNAGICAQILVDCFGADTLINTGIAGSLDARIDIGDMVISTDALHHDMDATLFGDVVGQVPRMDTLSFPADADLIRKAAEANEKANPDIHTFTGRIASGDQFIASKEVKDRIVQNFHPLCVEMEGAGIAHAAYLNQVSYVIIRAISDKADNSATMDYPTFERKAIAHSVRLIKELVPMI